MRIILALFLFCFSLKVSADTVVSRIEDIDYPEHMTGEILVFLSTGHVAKITENLIDLLNRIHDAKDNRTWLKITMNNSRFITDIDVTENITPRITNTKSMNLHEEYIPSVLKSPDWALRYFKESRKNNKESQCFNRAHVWSYEWLVKHKFKSSKVFLFFTRKFIREHQFTWWFHVAPSVHVVIGNQIKERVMDMKYTSQPSSVGEWVKHFIKVNPSCITVSTYSDYANFPENGNCYLMRGSMYTYWPLDLEHEELHGTIKADWVKEEIAMSYLEAFDIVKK